MSTLIAATSDALGTALATVEGLRVFPLGASLTPPGVVIGAPSLAWEGYAPAPTTATFPLLLVSTMDDRALERLWVFLEPVTAAVESLSGAVVTGATPGIFKAGAQDLPMYSIAVEVPL